MSRPPLGPNRADRPAGPGRMLRFGSRISGKTAAAAADRFVLFPAVALLALAMIAPAAWALAHAFFSTAEIAADYGPALSPDDYPATRYAILKLIPDLVTLKPLAALMFEKPVFLRLFWNSVLLAAPIVLGQTAAASLAAYAFAKLAFPGRETLFLVYVLTMLMPYQVLMVPNYLIADRLGLVGTWSAIVWPGVFGAFGVFLLRQFMVQLPNAYLEAGRIDGAGALQLFVRIVLPLSRPGLASLVILLFIDQWSMVEQPLLLLDDPFEQPLSLYLSRVHEDEPGLAFAASVLYMIPLLFVFLYGETELVEGIRNTGLKG